MKKIIILLGALLFFSTAVFAQSTTVQIGTNSANVGDTILVPINVTNLSNCAAISLIMNFTSGNLQFLGVANSAVTFNSGSTSNSVNLGWYDSSPPNNPLNIASGKLVDLKFKVLNSTTITFGSGCELTNEAFVNIPATLVPGAVNLFAVNVTIPNILAVPGSNVQIPIKVKKFTNIGAINLSINFNPSSLTFLSSTPVTLNGDPVSAVVTSPGVLSIGWYASDVSHAITLSDNSTLLNLGFTYIGGTGSLTFNNSACEISNINAVSLNTNYSGGIVSPNPGSVATLTLDTLHSIAGPVVVSLKAQLLNNIGAFNIKIKYNAAALTFNSLSGNYSGITISNNASGGVLTLGWYDATGTTPISIANGVLTNLNFTYVGGNVPLQFDLPNCELADQSGNILGTVVYQNGYVNQSITIIKNDLSGIPDTYNLYQNFPNPFNPSTIIRYDLPKEGFVTMKIYNLLGKEIRTLVNDFRQAGKYSVTFDASNLPSGIYVCSINSKDFSSVRKLMLLK